MKHTVTVAEINKEIIEQVLAASVGRSENKQLLFRYDIGRRRLSWIVAEGQSKHAYYTLAAAVEAYNKI